LSERESRPSSLRFDQAAPIAIPAHVDGVARALSLERLVSATENHASKSNSI
jgi:hypothetical protein